MQKELIENVDFYFKEHGYMVLTRKFLLDKGECCGNGCKNCPYQYIQVPEPMRTELLEARKPLQ